MVKPVKKTFNKLNFDQEEGRQDIYNWSQRRERKFKGYRKSVHVFRVFAFNTDLLRSFFENFNFMVILQMALAGLVTYACKSLNIIYDVHVSLFISPIVFPLAFSINTDFQRREKVLEDLANFKSSAMMWLFCMRDWREACSFDDNFMKAVGNKIKGILFHLREYLLTDKIDRRRFIARVIYEDFSDANQLIEKVRASGLKANSPLISRIIHFLNMMCLSYERLRVIREYRSPRSIRSFTKVLIFVLPMLLSPYYVHLGNTVKNSWSPYYISIMVAFVFGALQGVQDKLDDPFDGMSEDDIKLDTLDEWTFQSLEATKNRTYKIGRFQVSSNPAEAVVAPSTNNFEDIADGHVKRKHVPQKEKPSFKDRFVPHRHHHVAKSPMRSPRSIYSEDESKSDEFELHPYAGVLHNIKGNTTILRGGHIKKRDKSYDDLHSLNSTLNKETGKAIGYNQVIFGVNNSQMSIHSTTNTPVHNKVPETIQSLFNVSNPEQVNISIHETPLTSANVSASLENGKGEVPISGVASYLAMQKKHSIPLSRSTSRSSNSNGSLSPDGIYCKPAFVIGNNIRRGSLQNSINIPKSRFNVFNASNSSSTKPLLHSTLSIDSSDTITSSDDDGKIRPKSAQEHRNFNYNCLTGTSYSVSPVPILTAQSEGSMIHALKDEEIFI